MRTPVLVSIVTFHDASYLENCLKSVQRQIYPTRIKILDNGSGDEGQEAKGKRQEVAAQIAAAFQVECEVSNCNLGFSGGHNRNLANEIFEWALLLNADVILADNYLERLLKAAAQHLHKRVGLVGGKLQRMNPDGSLVQEGGRPVLDSTGIYFTPTLRHFDRGAGELDSGEYDHLEWVFGISGAVLLFSRGLYDDLRDGAEFLDEDFFVYREDADLAWRAQLRSWNALYVPDALARHARAVTPEIRRKLTASINCHSVKNRFLMRKKNVDWAVRLRCGPMMWSRDVTILFYMLLFERGSLPALRTLWRVRHRISLKRIRIQRDRTRKPTDIAWWFSFRPKSRPVPKTVQEDITGVHL